MQADLQQFRDLPNPIGTFETLFDAALTSLLAELAGAPWHVREREVVNLFVFGHLVPQFRDEHLDIRQLGIEAPILKAPESSREKRGKYADIVVWPHGNATIWRTCKPLAHIEWKHISCREKNPRQQERDHKRDILYLERDRQCAYVNYAVLTDQRDGNVEICCTRVGVRGTEDFFQPRLRCAAACPESAIAELQGPSQIVRSRPHACPYCSAEQGQRKAAASLISV